MLMLMQVDDGGFHNITSLISDCPCHSKLAFIVSDKEGSRMQKIVPHRLHFYYERRRKIAAGLNQLPLYTYAFLLYWRSCYRHV